LSAPGGAFPCAQVSVSRQPRSVWCCQCLRMLEPGPNMEPKGDVGPINHIAEHPDHVVIVAGGRTP
jgi:hypothetical protein